MNTPIGSDAPGLEQDGSLLKILARKMRDWLNRFLDEGGAPGMEGVGSFPRSGERGPHGEMLSSVDEDAPLPFELFFKPGPPEEWLRMVEEGAPELLLPPEEGGALWKGLRAKPVEFARPAFSPEDFLASIPAEQPEPEADKIDIAGTTSDAANSQRSETNTLPREEFGPNTNEPAFIPPSSPHPSRERLVRRDEGRRTPDPQLPAGMRTRRLANQAAREQVPRVRSAEMPGVSRLDQARGSQRREPPVEETSVSLPLGSRPPVREATKESRPSDLPDPAKMLTQFGDPRASFPLKHRSVDRSATNEFARDVQAASRRMLVGTETNGEVRADGESIGVGRKSSSGDNRDRIAPSRSAEVPPQSTELAGLTRPPAGRYIPVPSSRGVGDQNQPKAKLAYRFAETVPEGSKPALPAGRDDPWPELPPVPIISFESAHLARRLEHQRILDLEQQGEH